MAKMTLKSRSMTLIFHTSQEYPRMHFWCQFGDSSSNYVTSHCADKVKFTDGWTDKVGVDLLNMREVTERLLLQYIDRWMDRLKPIPPTSTLLSWGYNKISHWR